MLQDSLLDISSSSTNYYVQPFDISLNQSNTHTVLNDSTSKMNTSFDFYIIRISVEHKNFETDGMLNVKYLTDFLSKCIIFIFDLYESQDIFYIFILDTNPDFNI